jgi:hypothetical protein
MTPVVADNDAAIAKPPLMGKTRVVMYTLLAIMVLYLLFAYFVVPAMWKVYARRHPSYDDNPRITQTSDHHPGDPLNVSLIGTEEQIHKHLKAAGWFTPAPLGLKSDLKIGVDSVLSRPYDRAPVSKLYLFGLKEDLEFEQPVGHNPRQRHHVRFWKTGKIDDDGRPVWIGAASFDERVGVSHTTGQITHHIAPDVDAERDHLFKSLETTGHLAEFYPVADFHKKLEGRNGGGDRWYTDGRLFVGVIKTDL